MRALSITLWILSALFAALWTYGYVYIGAMACAFAGPQGSQNCTIRMPWQMQGEDLLLLVLVPGAVLLGLVTVAVITGRAASRRTG